MPITFLTCQIWNQTPKLKYNITHHLYFLANNSKENIGLRPSNNSKEKIIPINIYNNEQNIRQADIDK